MTAFDPAARAWWEWMWPMTWQVALLTAAVLAVTLLVRKRSPHLRYYLWCLVLVKLCVPPSLAFVTGIGALLPASAPEPVKVEAPASAKTALATAPAPAATARVAAEPTAPVMVAPAAVPSLPRVDAVAQKVPAGHPWKVLLFAAWAAGVLAMAALLALQYAAIRRRLTRGAAATDAGALALLDEARTALGVRRAVGLATVEGIGSPVLFGLLRPRIVLPAVALALPAEELRPILLHELAHLRRRDLWVNWAQAVLQSAYWFHPLVWLANARLRRERELIVDDMVLARLGGERTAYGASLVSVLKQSARRRMLTPGYVGIAEPPGSVAARVRRILDGKRKLSLGLGIVGAAVVLAVGLVLIPQGHAAQKEAPQPDLQAASTASSTPAQSQQEPRWAQVERERFQPLADKIQSVVGKGWRMDVRRVTSLHGWSGRVNGYALDFHNTTLKASGTGEPVSFRLTIANWDRPTLEEGAGAGAEFDTPMGASDHHTWYRNPGTFGRDYPDQRQATIASVREAFAIPEPVDGIQCRIGPLIDVMSGDLFSPGMPAGPPVSLRIGDSPVGLPIDVLNVSGKTLSVLDMGDRLLEAVVVRDEAGRRLPYLGKPLSGQGSERALPPGGGMYAHLQLAAAYGMAKPGRYTIQVPYRFGTGEKDVAFSQEVTIHAVPKDFLVFGVHRPANSGPLAVGDAIPLELGLQHAGPRPLALTGLTVNLTAEGPGPADWLDARAPLVWGHAEQEWRKAASAGGSTGSDLQLAEQGWSVQQSATDVLWAPSSSSVGLPGTPFWTYAKSGQSWKLRVRLIGQANGEYFTLLSEPVELSVAATGGSPGPCRATLPNGVTVELVGVSYHPSEAKQWWRPDGSPLAQAPDSGSVGTLAFPADRQFAVRLSEIPQQTWEVRARVPQAVTTVGGSFSGNETVQGLLGARFPEGTATCSVQIGVAAGEWKAVAQSNGLGRSTADVGGHGIVLGTAQPEGNGTRISVSHDMRDMDVRVVAVDKAGHLHPPGPVTTSSAGAVVQPEVLFSELPLEQIAEFQVQTRRVQWIEFRNVSLEPGRKTNVEVSVESVPAGEADMRQQQASTPLAEPPGPTPTPSVPFPNVDESAINPDIAALVRERIARHNDASGVALEGQIVAMGDEAVPTLMAMAEKAADADPLVLHTPGVYDYGWDLRLPARMLAEIGDRRAIPLISALVQYDTKPGRMFESLASVLSHGTLQQIEADTKSSDPNVARAAEMLLENPDSLGWWRDRFRPPPQASEQATVRRSPAAAAAAPAATHGKVPPELVLALARRLSFIWSEKSGTVQQCVGSLQKDLPINYLVSGFDASLAARTLSLQTTTNQDRLLDIICELTGHGWQVQEGTILVGSAHQFGSPSRLVGEVPAEMNSRLGTSVALGFKDLPLEQAAAFLQRTSGIEFRMEKSNLPAPALAVTVTTQTRLEHAVNLLCILTGYVWEVKDGAILLRPDPRPDRLPWRELMAVGATSQPGAGARTIFPVGPGNTNAPFSSIVGYSRGSLRLYTSDDTVRLALIFRQLSATSQPFVLELYPLSPIRTAPRTPVQVVQLPAMTREGVGRSFDVISEPLDLKALPDGVYLDVKPQAESTAGEEKSP